MTESTNRLTIFRVSGSKNLPNNVVDYIISNQNTKVVLGTNNTYINIPKEKKIMDPEILNSAVDDNLLNKIYTYTNKIYTECVICDQYLQSQTNDDIQPDDFDAEYYMKSYPDVVQGGFNTPGKAYQHWIRYGQFESRIPKLPSDSPPDETPADQPPLYSSLDVLYMGSGHQPNVDGLHFLIKLAFQLPEYTFKVIGSVCGTILENKDPHWVNNRRDSGEPMYPNNIELLGIVSEEEKQELLTCCDIAINPVISGGGTNLKTIEYISAGLPVVCSEYSVKNIDIPVDTVCVCKDNDVESFKQGIINIIEHTNPAKAIDHIKRIYTWDIIAKKYYNLIKKTATLKHNKITVVNLFPVGIRPNSGGEQRIFYLYEALAKYINVELISLNHDPNSTVEIEMMSENFVQKHIPRHPDAAKVGMKIEEHTGVSCGDVALLSDFNLITNSDVYHKDVGYCESAFINNIAHSALNSDCVITSHIYTYNMVKNLKNTIIYDSHNCEYDLKQQIYKESKLTADVISKIKEVEIEACNRADLIVSCSKSDIALFNAHIKNKSSKLTNKNLIYNGYSSSAVHVPRYRNNRSVNIFLCCRNNEQTLPKTLSDLRKSELLHGDKYTYYIYENDSTDRTPQIVTDHYTISPGNFKTGIENRVQHASNPGLSRVTDMAHYRNGMKNLCTDFSSEYSIILDTEINFKKDTVDRMIKFMDDNPDVAMLTPFGVLPENHPGRTTDNEYYDLFAYMHQEGYGGLKYIIQQDGRWDRIPYMGTSLPCIDDGITDVKSAFSGFVCIRSDILRKCNWGVIDGDHSEHVPFCMEVNKYGRVIINTDFIVDWNV